MSISGYQVPSEPHMDAEGLAFFKQELHRIRGGTYLEYGGGGSTVLASQFVNALATVDSDRRYLAAVARKIPTFPQQTRLVHVDIGLTVGWGRPAIREADPAREKRWREYPERVWRLLKETGSTPDLVLIDGRFRVACFLHSILNLQENRDAVLLVDDYAQRPGYRAVEPFADFVGMKGRMAVFKPKAELDRAACEATYEQHIADFM